MPGHALATYVWHGARSDRPSVALPSDAGRLAVPLDTIRQAAGDRWDIFPPSRPARQVVPLRVATWIESGGTATAWDALSPGDRKVGRRLWAAAARDILALPEDQLAKTCGLSDVRAVRRAIAQARGEWARIGAWPWVHFAKSRPPDDWRSAPMTPALVIPLRVWRAGGWAAGIFGLAGPPVDRHAA